MLNTGIHYLDISTIRLKVISKLIILLRQYRKRLYIIPLAASKGSDWNEMQIAIWIGRTARLDTESHSSFDKARIKWIHLGHENIKKNINFLV